jgi:hypothetical protein
MAAQAPDGTIGRLAGAAGIALVLVGLTLLLEPASRRPLAAVLLALGLAVGVAVAMRRPPSARLRTPMERLNDAAFLVVVAVVALIAVRLARPWTAALPGLVGGALLGLALRPAPAATPGPRSGLGPGSGSGSGSGADPGRAGTSPPGADPPGGGA